MEQEIKNISIVWKSEYNINNFLIDREHQDLFSIAREALNISKLKNDKEQIEKLKVVITKLFNYTKIHFSNEQQYMELISYPDLEEHKFLHKNMLNMLTNLISELNTMELEKIQKSLFNFIEEYFVRHIILEDKKIQLWNTNIDDLKKNFGWKEIYSVQNPMIDAEHKKLFEIAQEAFIDVDPLQKSIKIKNVLTKLYDYMKTHFKHEEEYMEEISYPKIQEHKKLHHKIIEDINSLVRRLPSLNEELFEKELAKLIDIALVHHIIQEDRKIINWVKNY
jgi:hemerythrin